MAKFRARARTLDMLGRQQIANIPTAVSELFKNAHDAYANAVEADYFRVERLFVLRDDGIGMTEVEFVDRWLTLGTESKLVAPNVKLPYVPPGRPQRPLLGEKGIGRLAIASIGSQVLVLTRAKRGNTVHPLIAAFIPWNLFTVPSVDLDAVEIPMRTFAGGALPSGEDVRALVASARDTVKKLQRYTTPDVVQRMLSDLAMFEAVDPKSLDAVFRSRSKAQLTLSDGRPGTHFFIRPTEDTIDIDLDGTPGAATAPPMVKMLIGFTNTLAPGSGPVMHTALRDHKSADSVVDVTSEKDFFSPDDLSNADHTVAGRFDEKGRFLGKVRVFDKILKYALEPVIRPNDIFHCGPFGLAFGYLQGVGRESLLYQKDPESFAELTARLDRIGGLYVYRDGIRILPYGDIDFDFLGIEERRNKGFSYYFFSYRRMFGAIDLTREHNFALHEKAGREGFRRNKAYQQFTDSLTNLLIQLAAEFFREGGARADIFQHKKEELDKSERLRRERNQFAHEQLGPFSSALGEALKRLDRGAAAKSVKDALRSVEQNLQPSPKMRDPETASRLIESAERDAIQQLERVRESLKVERPRSVALPAGTRRDWTVYLDTLQAFERETLVPARQRIEVAVASALRETRGSARKAKRAQAAIASVVEEARNGRDHASTALTAEADALQSRVRALVQRSTDELEKSIGRALERVSQLDPEQLGDAEFARERVKIEEDVRVTGERGGAALRRVRDVVADLAKALSSGSPMPDELTEALEEELLALRERADADLQLTQLGMAIDIINHEFSASIRTVRGAIKRLKTWADRNAALGSVYTDLRASFDHLDGYLRLFTPLHRRLYRNAVEMRGSEIAGYLQDLFRERLRRH